MHTILLTGVLATLAQLSTAVVIPRDNPAPAYYPGTISVEVLSTSDSAAQIKVRDSLSDAINNKPIRHTDQSATCDVEKYAGYVKNCSSPTWNVMYNGGNTYITHLVKFATSNYVSNYTTGANMDVDTPIYQRREASGISYDLGTVKDYTVCEYSFSKPYDGYTEQRYDFIEGRGRSVQGCYNYSPQPQSTDPSSAAIVSATATPIPRTSVAKE